MHYRASVAANSPFIYQIAARYLLCDALTAAQAVTITLSKGGQVLHRGPLSRRTSLYAGVGGFDSVMLESSDVATVDFFASQEKVSIGESGDVTVVNTEADPVKVEIVSPVSLTVSGVTVDNLTSAPVNVRARLADTLIDTGLVAATDVLSALVAADATRRGFRVRNAGPDAVAIGGAAVTYAAAAIIIQAGETWNEDDAPGAAWKCICDAGATASLYVLEVAQ